MAEITAEAVRVLREKSGAGLMLCKKALEETGGDLTRAIEYLRKQGQQLADKKSSRAAKEGRVGTLIRDDLAVILELNSETDFVSRNEKFGDLLNHILQAAADHRPATAEALLAIRSPLLGGRTVREAVTESVAVIGENIGVGRFALMPAEPGAKIFTYIHMGGKIGVLLKLAGVGSAAAHEAVLNLGKDLCMQVAAARPLSLRREDIPKDKTDGELAIYRELARKEGKPEKILDKIVQGKLEKFFAESCLSEQLFVKDPEKKISQVIDQAGRAAGVKPAVAAFIRYQLGEE